MANDYQIPAITLIAALLLAFGYLRARFRSVRILLWLLALACAEIQAILVPVAAHLWAKNGGQPSPRWLALNVTGESALMLSSVLFLASLAPLSFRIGRFRVLYAVPYLIPLVAYTALFSIYAPQSATQPPGPLLWIYVVLAVWAAIVALLWSLRKSVIPIWMAVVIVCAAAGIAFQLFLRWNAFGPLLVAESGNLCMAALLVLYTYRRLTPGVVLSCFGFIAWALPPVLSLEPIVQLSWAAPYLQTVIYLGRVLTALGLILLVLEREIDHNQAAQQRERRVRLEIEAYARQALTARSLEEFDRNSAQICSTIVEHSRFASAAMVVRGASGAYTLVGYAGFDGATAGALDALAHRLPPDCFAASTSTPPLAPKSFSLDLDLAPWLTPGDDLERLHVTRVGAVPLLGTDNSAEGALLLTGLRAPSAGLDSTLRADDLLPLEIFAGRLQAARAQAMMLGKLIQSERFAGVGQLATNVAQQLNNPLTVILGYSVLLEESTPPGIDRRGAEAISSEARRMKTILERLSRFSSLATERFSSFSVADLLSDIEQLSRTDFLRHSIEFRLSIEPGLPDLFGNPHQIRQALLHAVQFAMDGARRADATREKSIRIEASSSEGRLHILIAHSGPGFPHPDRAFDSLTAGFSGSESTGIGLSLCAAIVHEHRGSITASNYEPSGAGILFDLPVS